MMVRVEAWHTCLLLLPILVLFHLYLSPFTKVEESFNIQAAHDILTNGIPTSNIALKFKAQYDHVEFPGAVPRTFIGAILLAGIARPLTWLGEGIDQQRLVRAILGLFNAVALMVYAAGARQSFGKTTAIWYTALQASQFHLFYYASRTLPNMFAFGLSTIALRCLLPDPVSTATRIKRTRLAIYLLTIAAVIFRSELALLLASQCAYLLIKAANNQARLSLLKSVMIPAGMFGAIAGLALTVSIDTFFWQSQTPLWPELSAFLSNVFPSSDSLGASAWGTSPWHWYFTSALPRLLINPLVVLAMLYSIFCPITRSSALDLAVPNLTYVVIYSMLAHKETRFVFPVLPPLTLSAALFAHYLTNMAFKSSIYRFCTLLLTLSTVAVFFLSHLILLPLSALSYPGGLALQTLHTLPSPFQPRIHVHLCTLALQTGTTRFLQHPLPRKPLILYPGTADNPRSLRSNAGQPLWIYDKSDNATEQLDVAFWQQFDYVVVEDVARVPGAWELREVIYALGGVKVLKPGERAGRRVLGKGKIGRWSGVFDLQQTSGVDHRAGGAADAAYTGGTGLYGYGRVEYLLYAWDVLHDVLREGVGVGVGVASGTGRDTSKHKSSWSWTRGWWVEPNMVERLYILERTEAGIGE